MPMGPQFLRNWGGAGSPLEFGKDRTELLSGAGPTGGCLQGRAQGTEAKDTGKANFHRQPL